MAVVNLLPSVLPGIKVTHAERQVALLRDVFRTTLKTEETVREAGFPEAVVASVNRLTRFDVGFPHLEHMSVVAKSNDLTVKRVAMAVLLREQQAATSDEAQCETPERRERRRKALEIVRRGVGY